MSNLLISVQIFLSSEWCNGKYEEPYIRTATVEKSYYGLIRNSGKYYYMGEAVSIVKNFDEKNGKLTVYIYPA